MLMEPGRLRFARIRNITRPLLRFNFPENELSLRNPGFKFGYPARDDLLPCQSPEQKATKYDEKNIRKPDQQFRVGMRISTQGIANDNKQKIGRGDDQTHGEPD